MKNISSNWFEFYFTDLYTCVFPLKSSKKWPKKKNPGTEYRKCVCGGWGWGVDLCTNTRIGNKCHWHKAYQFSIYIKIYLHECVLIQYKRKEWNWTPELRSLILCLLKRFGNAVVLPAPTFLCHLCNLINKSPFLWLPKRRHNDTPLLNNRFLHYFWI